ncbi:hypothetical protein MtrunA17_Chr7g0254871 [Medicago truncatula]|uniref:Uncharacterized protein n=1 Tax=Medicago truncatula TaxID=3880 RepID=A0A396H2N5_MEDTR|nr:hypothetical protein MtrunA17_Chr7g0254871 [Medicago truncatula]
MISRISSVRDLCSRPLSFTNFVVHHRLCSPLFSDGSSAIPCGHDDESLLCVRRTKDHFSGFVKNLCVLHQRNMLIKLVVKEDARSDLGLG